jgi:hypothetical protein
MLQGKSVQTSAVQKAEMSYLECRSYGAKMVLKGTGLDVVQWTEDGSWWVRGGKERKVGGQ